MKKKKSEIILPLLVLILLLLGVLVLASTSATIAQEHSKSSYYFLRHQVFFALIPGVILAFFFTKIPLSFLKNNSFPLLILNLLFCGLVFLPQFTKEFSGANRWIGLGPVSLQPSEFLKVTFLIYLAAWLTKKRKSKESLMGFFAILFPIALLFILQPDISTLGVIAASAITMYFLSETSFWHIMLIVIIGLVVLFSLTKTAPYRLARLTTFLRPKLDPLGSGFQISQSLIAIGSGGLFGKGFGLSAQKLGFLPGVLSDSIFAVFAEETGFLGASILISLFLIFLLRGMTISKRTKNEFLRLLCLGITSWITLQAFVNIGAMTGIFPLTGIPLPFISYGGSHLVAELIGIGILLNIARS